MKFVFYLISQHTHRVKTLLSFVGERKGKKKNPRYLATWLICYVWGSLLIKNVGVILSFDKNKTDLDC